MDGAWEGCAVGLCVGGSSGGFVGDSIFGLLVGAIAEFTTS